jgi:hypothetical protein
VSLSDPDSRRLRKGGKVTVGHNVQTGVDSKHHLIVAAELVQAGNDSGQLEPIARESCQSLEVDLAGESIQVAADAGYWNLSQVAACEASGMEVHVPAKKKRPAGEGSVRDEDFTYDEEADEYICPAGKRLDRHADSRRRAVSYRVYYRLSSCRGCDMLGKCTKGKYRKFTVSEHEAVAKKVKARIELNPEVYRRRKGIVEHVFGTMKESWGFGQFMVRGKIGCQGELSLMALSYNWKRVLKIVGPERMLAAVAA